MNTQLEEIREQQRKTWNKSSAGWKKWDQLMSDFLWPVADEMIRLLHPGGNDVVLDVAAGTGEPGLTIAERLTGGKVISADVAEDMLAIARENAAKRGIKNFETTVADVTALPFADNTFDAVSCRYGFMFFPDMLMAAKEMARVLKPGGRLAVAVWLAPEKNFWYTGVMSVAGQHIELPVPVPGGPSMFRCATPGLITGLFKQAGMKNITEFEIPGKLRSGTAEYYWQFASECVGPIVTALGNTDEAMREKIHGEVIDFVNQKYPGGDVAIDSSTLVVYAEK